MSATKRFLEDISVLLGELGQLDEKGEKYTGQIDTHVCVFADSIEAAYQQIIIASHLKEMEHIDAVSRELDKILGSEDTLLHRVFLKYQALEVEREQEVLSREDSRERC